MGIVSLLYMTQLAGKEPNNFQQLSFSKGSGPNWYQIGNKTHYTPKVCKFYVEKRRLC